jgi:co-chaperonin GroES (HSP10)
MSDDADSSIPKPVGYKLLVMIEERPDTFDGTQIVKSDTTKTQEEHAMQVGRVIDMGPECYQNSSSRTFTKAWCQIGDYVLLDRYGGMKFRVGPRLFRLVNDDSVDAVVEDPKLLVKLGF